METLLALIKIINPIEWLKECYKMPKCVKLAAILVCFVILFLPDAVRGISAVLLKKISFWLIPINTISFIGECLQEKYLQKQTEKLKEQQNLEKLRQQEQEKEKLKKEQAEKDQAEKERQAAKIKETTEKYYQIFDLCDECEKQILEQFYCKNKTSIDVSIRQDGYIAAMKAKGIKFIGCNYIGINSSCKAYLTIDGFEIVQAYFNKDKEKFFDIIQKLNEKEFNLIKKFYLENDNEMFLSKRQIKTAHSLSDILFDNGFRRINFFNEEKMKIAEAYLSYLRDYFSKNNI